MDLYVVLGYMDEDVAHNIAQRWNTITPTDLQASSLSALSLLALTVCG